MRLSPFLAEVSLDHGAFCHHVAGGTLGDHLPMVEYDETIRKAHHGVHGMLDNDDRHACPRQA
jgi:hypothetical protein